MELHGLYPFTITEGRRSVTVAACSPEERTKWMEVRIEELFYVYKSRLYVPVYLVYILYILHYLTVATRILTTILLIFSYQDLNVAITTAKDKVTVVLMWNEGCLFAFHSSLSIFYFSSCVKIVARTRLITL